MAGSSTTGRDSARAAPKRTATPKRTAAPKRAAPQSAKAAAADNPLAGAFGGVVRGSVNSVMGSVGPNVPHTLLTERLDRVPLMRPNRRERKAARSAAANGE